MKIKNLLICVLAILAAFACKPIDTPVEEPVLTLSTSKMVFNSFGGERPLSITANNAWTIEADVDWISFGQNSGEASDDKQQVMVYIDENPEVNADPRVGTVTVKSGELSKDVEVSQSAAEFVPELTVNAENMTASADGQELTFTLISNVAWTAVSDVEWVSFEPASGEASEAEVSVKVTVAPNSVFEERTAKVTVSGEGVEETFNIVQGFHVPLTVSTENLTAVADGEALTFTLSARAAWTAVTESDWVTLDPASGDAAENVTVTATVAENVLTEPRTAVVKVSAAGMEKTVTIVQAKNAPRPVAMEGDGSEANPYLIKIVGNMLAVRDAAKLNETTYFRMENDIDMSEVESWTPINYDEGYAREIHFDGNNKTISNFYSDKTVHGGNYSSIFGVLNGSCRNLKIDNARIVSTNGCGVIAAYVGTTGLPAVLENVVITNSIVEAAGDRSGGVCGTAKQATIRNVSFQGTVISTFSGEAKIGGFVGHTETEATFEDCSVDVVLEGHGSDIAGFAGKTTGSVSFTGCKAKAVVTSYAAAKNRCGGFIGWNSTSKTVMTDCHVLKGSSLKDMSGRAAASNGNYGGLIGFGDTKGTVLEISGCSTDVVVDGGLSTYNSCFISYLGYASTTVISNSCAAGEVKNGVANYVGGLLGCLETAAVLTVTGSHFSGNVNAGGGYVGGIVGGAKGILTLSTTYSTGSVSAAGSYVGGLIGASMNDAVKVSDCYSTAKIYAYGQQVGGLVGTTTNKLTMTDCYASGDVYSATSGAAGIVGRVQKSSSITNCIAWNRNIATSRYANNVYAPGAILGCAQQAGTYSGCWRRYDMLLTDDFMVLCDQEDFINAMPSHPAYSTETHQQAYHGKAAPKEATIASLAQSLGWNPEVWNFASEGSSLGFTIKQLGDNKIEF